MTIVLVGSIITNYIGNKMKRILLNFTVVTITFFLNNLLFAQNNQDFSTTKQKLWELEEKYMLSYKDRNPELLNNFWNENFIGWPEWASSPLNIDQAKTALNKEPNNVISSYKIRPQKIVLKDSLAVVFYFVDLELVNQKEEKDKATYRIIHTWIKQNNQWSIIGGMSAK